MKGIKTKFLNSNKLPLVVEPTNASITLPEALQILQENKTFFNENLLTYGGLLFRNFPIANANDFVALLKNIGMKDFYSYIGGDSPRKKVVDGVYTSTEAPPSFKLPLHNEMSYVNTYPSHIHFYCEIAPKAKGETIIGDCRKIYQGIDKEVRERFEKNGLQYISRYPYKSKFMSYVVKSHKSWTNVFETEDKKEAERKCRENGITFKWNKNDWIEIKQKRPSILVHPLTQEKVWFNQAHHYDFNPKFLGWLPYLAAKLFYFRKYTLLHEIYFGDQSKIPRSDLYHIMDVMDKNTVYFPWQKGDVLVLDNILTMHGRSTFSGPRRILTAMTN